jgi:AcrR family transcriptional regulator
MRSVDGVPLNEAILRAATQTFVGFGYDNASMDEVAARARTTKRTVYAHFGSKEALFRAAVGRAVAHVHEEMPPLADPADPHGELTRFAVAFLELSTRYAAVHLQRVVMGAADRFADLGVLLHRDVLQHAEARIAAYLRRIGVTGGDGEDDLSPEALAALFLNATSGPRRFETLFGARDPLAGMPAPGSLSASETAEVSAAAALFLRGLPR